MSPYKMVIEVIDQFNFQRVFAVMECLDWRWSGKKTPDLSELRRCAYGLLVDAIEVAHECAFENESIGYFSATGGFKATAFKGEDNRVNHLQLEFIVEEQEYTTAENYSYHFGM